MKGNKISGNKKFKPKYMYILGFVLMILGLLSSVWVNFLFGIVLFFGGIILYMIGMGTRNKWNI